MKFLALFLVSCSLLAANRSLLVVNNNSNHLVSVTTGRVFTEVYTFEANTSHTIWSEEGGKLWNIRFFVDGVRMGQCEPGLALGGEIVVVFYDAENGSVGCR